MSRFQHLLAGQIGVSEALSDDAEGGFLKASPVGAVAVVEAVRLLVEIAEQMERLNGNVGARIARLSKVQKFSIPFVWTLPRTYSSA